MTCKETDALYCARERKELLQLSSERITNQNPDKAAICEIELKNGRTCGVSAIGRCTTCERAFCRSHQARTSTNISDGRFMPFSVPVYLDMCQECFATSPMELSRIKAEEDAARYKQEKEEEQRKLHGPAWDAMDYIQKGEARTALRSSSVQPVKIYRTESKTKKTLFGLSSRRVEEVVSVQSGWILGELQLAYTTRLYGDDIWEIRNASKRTIYSKKHVHVVNDLKACPILPSNRSTCPQP